MFERLLPKCLDNEYRGRALALWLFGLVVLMKSIQSLSIILAGNRTAMGADGIPLDTFPPTAAQAVLAVFAQHSLWRLSYCLLCLLALFRYRSAVPLMFALLVANYIGGQIIFHFVQLPRVGTPPGPAINLVLFCLMIVGLVLIAQASADRLAGDNMNPGMPGDAQMPGDGAPGSGGEPGIAPGVEPKWPFLGNNETPGANGQLPGDGASGSGAGSGGIAPGPKTADNATPGANGQLPGDGASGSGAGSGGIAPGPKLSFNGNASPGNDGMLPGDGAPGSGAGTPTISSGFQFGFRA